MSTNIQLFRDLPKLRLHAADPSPPSESSASPASTTAAASNSDAVHPEEDSREEECRTPTSEESRISAVMTCPPAPKKPRYALSGKRKLSELDSFETLHGGEIEEFFHLASARIASEAPKRRRFSKRIVA
ncbi:hypothetical protein SAY87_019301 [Trapa incisa]|uniref:Cyclin-dependent protein kinase inhibitor SMR1 n=1 Tax=Trapa incisa TaxID=236973 RepID=A0AAN7Q730_9MYRT|nr:hypothetical protein SAY87_019301 [Trapa incisa]